ncbi:alpha-D-ribose 1-methylphosphonate 5-triphosphate diphosphatase [Rhodosalinus sp. K401]|uniref:alpha-D-ribose 1-methylphosphonate 5-triphosphate diphosphatase n=1 Tax=Rhodosalinus sp. K401 TaxID=3239195 RepID=UPI00352428CB
MSLALTLHGAEVLWPDGAGPGPVGIAGGRIAPPGPGRQVDLSGYLVLPGIVDAHGDGFERHLAPRRGAMRDLGAGLAAAEAELAANGITTAVLAQFYSWEGGLRGPDFAARVLEGWSARRGGGTDLRIQLRFETHMLDDYPAFEALVARHGAGYVVFNDHLPHDRLSQGRRPSRLTGQALKSGRSPEAHLAIMEALHVRQAEVPQALAGLAQRLSARGVRLGSHDDRTAADRAFWRGIGVRIAEFPETREAALAAIEAGDGVVMGAPNVMRGGSHNGNVPAGALVDEGLVTALASDYHFPSLRAAALALAEPMGLAAAWRLVSEGPAGLLGLADRGRIALGLRADLVVLERETGRVAATFAGGALTFMGGPVAARFLD